jgi:hypothetical protein
MSLPNHYKKHYNGFFTPYPIQAYRMNVLLSVFLHKNFMPTFFSIGTDLFSERSVPF